MARITPLHLIPALIAASSQAGEITIERRPFIVEKSFTAVALPAEDGKVLRLDPKLWSDFKIAEIVPHGTRVTADMMLVRFDTTKIDEKITAARQGLAVSALKLKQAEVDLEALKATAPERLESSRRRAEIAKEEHHHFTQVRRKSAEEMAAHALKRTEQIWANQREELKQLSKMYEADDLTEDTEEIILIRQQDAVAAAEFALRMESLDHRRTLEVSLPREANSLAVQERETALQFQKAETDIPRATELSRLELEVAKVTHDQATQDFDQIVKDREQFEMRAPGNGWFYHGAIEKGQWSVGENLKHLVPNGRPPAHSPFATFIPETAPIYLISFLDEATARSLPPNLTGIATLTGREEMQLPVKVIAVASLPDAAGTYRADLAVTWSETPPAPGLTARVHFACYQQQLAISVPTKALRYEASGWTIEVKLADGKTESRAITLGRVSKEATEVLSGLEIGQVIVVP